jgi:hypothetical protein
MKQTPKEETMKEINNYVDSAMKSVTVVVVVYSLGVNAPIYSYIIRIIGFIGLYWAIIPLIENIKIIKQKRIGNKFPSHSAKAEYTGEKK